ncbi:MAG: ATPase, T2SS/T4P/T4SS family [Candidatus Zipacnadales bacterium]
MAIRYLDAASLRGLGLRDADIQTLDQALRRGRGLLFVCGPPHSGRSSAMYSLLCALNDHSHSLASAERSLRHRIPGVAQSEIGAEDSLSDWLHVISRADPDALMVSGFEGLRDAIELTRAAAHAIVIVGSLAESSLAPLCQLVQLGLPVQLVCRVVSCVMSTRLVPRLCTACRRPLEHYSGRLNMLRNLLNVELPRQAFEARGCAHCRGTGRRGEVGLYEVHEVGPQLESILSGEYSTAALEEAGLRTTLTALIMDGLIKAEVGRLDLRDLAPLFAQWRSLGGSSLFSNN